MSQVAFASARLEPEYKDDPNDEGESLALRVRKVTGCFAAPKKILIVIGRVAEMCAAKVRSPSSVFRPYPHVVVCGRSCGGCCGRPLLLRGPASGRGEYQGRGHSDDGVVIKCADVLAASRSRSAFLA